ncbi:ATP-dependent DNA helicase RecG [Chamaesiphon minutus]|uniref:ATP-dependent DNA helicase RecG n=1 Tax=Chamaesiphon minutus (strain ATCC 27169 / PCC 6605) TaxID=1173020 RepID=K9UHF1_CHAP6|nr:ATP-dependent DNA helicase RecG [Chamaesiphon minutus]AFY94537.1 ATP-dependent DNA helicase RecG [Chamaesiphon minutus PCC 6605]
MSDAPDWSRIQKALAVEAQYGYTDLVGQQYRFGEFLCLSFGKPPAHTTSKDRQHWRELAFEFDKYHDLTLVERRELIARASQFLTVAEQVCAHQHGDRSVPAPTVNESPRQIIPSKPTANLKVAPATIPVRGDTNLTLDRYLRDIPKLGIRKAEILARLGLLTVKDVLYYYPRDHIDYAKQINIIELEPGTTVTLVGIVRKINFFTSPKNKKLNVLELTIKDETGQLKISRFYAGTRYSSRGWQESLKRKYPVGSWIAASGLVKQGKYGINLDNPEIEVLADADASISSLKIGRVLPVYPLIEGVSADVVREAVVTVLPAAEQLTDPLPKVVREQYGLMELAASIQNIHFPEDSDTKEAARRRLIFDEFFYLQLGFLQRRHLMRQVHTQAIITPTGVLIDRFRELLPFQLTNAQQRVVSEILSDLQLPAPMNRLVQGDVGSGKTVVAVLAILAAIQSGYQTALMAPTEVLAEQHYRKLVGWFNLLHLPVELLTGSTKAAKRRQIYSELETGELSIAVGTHALIQDKVNFRNLGLVVIDEQHRFGVFQRAKLQQKGSQPHVLTMTATPIPRTLALTLHGDLDVSQIDELPAGRQPIQTNAVNSRQRSQVYELMHREIAQGRQVYIVLPLVEESEKLDLRAATEEHERLATEVFPQYQVGLLHGRMSSADKDAAITAFRDNLTQIIVSTTVIEVGVDVPNATVMLIENAERFGLSQLHQLRGRVGRGAHRSYCLLMSSSTSGDAKQRLQVLEQSQDGFWISEMDMQLRGPGQVLGTRQSGMADFALASLAEDGEVLTIARDAAEKVILQDNDLSESPRLKAELDYRFQKLMGGSILT